MCVSHLQALQTPAVSEPVSPDRDRRRKTRSKDGHFTHNTEENFTPYVSQQDISVGVSVSTAEAESLDVSMRLET
jgi:hypothetical protein